MPLYDVHCEVCGFTDERVLPIGVLPVCPECKAKRATIQPMVRGPGGNTLIKMKGMGGYPSRRKQIFNTTNRNHPKLG